MTLAFFAFDDVSTPLDLDYAAQQIALARQQNDVIVVSMHWGHEYQAAPSKRQRLIADALTKAGADIIWGHHPHVLQETAWMDTGRKHNSLVAYSLGNALFDQVVPQDTRQSAILLVTIDKEGGIGFTAEPFEIDPFAGTVKISRGEVANQILERLKVTPSP